MTSKDDKMPEEFPTYIADWNSFCQWIERLNTINWIFRGVSSKEHKLIPKLGRPENLPTGTEDLLNREKWLLDEFERMALAYIHQGQQPGTLLELMALAQHHGLPTRLLDWSFSPLVAAFFSVEKPTEEDSVIFAYDSRELISSKTSSHLHIIPPRVVRFDPPHISPRITAQAATFTIHPLPEIPMDDVATTLIIEKEFRKKLKGLLNKLGINRSTLFPDLDGLSTFLTWKNKILKNWGN